MRKTLKKLVAVALTAGMLVSTFTSGVVAQEETKELKKGTVITDFKEIKDVSELEPGKTYFFSSEEYDVESAVATLPDGSAILQFAGTDVQEAVDAGTFFVIPEYLESYEVYRLYAYNHFYKDDLDRLPATAEQAYVMLAEIYGWSSVPTSWEEVLAVVPEAATAYPTVDDYLAAVKPQRDRLIAEYEEEFPEDLNEFFAYNGYEFNTWDEYLDDMLDDMKSTIERLPNDYAYEYVQQEQQGYVAVVQSGEGFDGCPYGTIAYLTEETDIMKEQLDIMRYDWQESSFEGPGWYYGCSNSGVGYVGPFYLYSYKVNTFTADDLIVTFRDDWQEPTQPTTVTKDDLTLSIVVDGEEIIIPFFELSDANVDPEHEDTIITITVDEIEKVVDLCNEVEPGDVEKDVQVGEGAPDTGFNNDVEELMEMILTEAEAKLVENGVNVDIFLTVANKDEEALGEDKELLEAELGEDDKAVYLDLKLFKQIGSGEPKAISEVTGGKIKISIEVPEEIKEFAAIARIIRVHGTEVDELATTYDATTNKLTFETDKFSTYAIVYKDATDNTGSGNENSGTGNQTPDTGNQTPDAGNKAPDTGDKAPVAGDKTPTTENKAPDAGDSSMVGLYIAIIAVAAVAFVMRKRVTSM